MKSLVELDREIKAHEKSSQELQALIDDYDRKKILVRQDMDKTAQIIYHKTVCLCHIKEIYRMAKVEFSRLRNSPEPILTVGDIKELDKWVGRASNEDGLMCIKNALGELKRYKPADIKSNLYALVQRIIIGGPFPKDKK